MTSNTVALSACEASKKTDVAHHPPASMRMLWVFGSLDLWGVGTRHQSRNALISQAIPSRTHRTTRDVAPLNSEAPFTSCACSMEHVFCFFPVDASGTVQKWNVDPGLVVQMCSVRMMPRHLSGTSGERSRRECDVDDRWPNLRVRHPCRIGWLFKWIALC